MMSDQEEIGFEEQLKLEEEERKRLAEKRTKVDDDGTEYEWDEDKRAWFPKIDNDFIAQYQMNYGNYKADEKTAEETANTSSSSRPDPSDPGYAAWYYKWYYSEGPGKIGNTSDSSSKAYHDYWNYYYWYQQQGGKKEQGNIKDEDGDKNIQETSEKENLPVDAEKHHEKIEKNEREEKKDNNDPQKEDEEEQKSKKGTECKSQDNEMNEAGSSQNKSKQDESSDAESTDSYSYDDYYAYYHSYYSQQRKEGQEGATEGSDDAYWNQYYNYYYPPEQKEGDGDNMGEKTEKVQGTEESKESEKTSKKRKATKEPPKWFELEDEHNTNVYVSGLPLDMTDEEFEELMKKYGMVMYDPHTRGPKIKLYKDENGQPKGDGRCCYIKSESVGLAMQLLDGSDLRGNGQVVKVEKATFTMKGNFDPSKRKKISKQQRKKMKAQQEKLFEWRPDKPRGYRGKNEKTVVIKRLFRPEDVNDPVLSVRLRDRVKEECMKHGAVKKVTIYDRHVEGIATVMFQDPVEADQCIAAMNGRFFMGKEVSVETWDGKTKFAVEESEEQREDRLKEWATYLGDEGSATANKAAKTKPQADVNKSVSSETQLSTSTGEHSTLPRCSDKMETEENRMMGEKASTEAGKMETDKPDIASKTDFEPGTVLKRDSEPDTVHKRDSEPDTIHKTDSEPDTVHKTDSETSTANKTDSANADPVKMETGKVSKPADVDCDDDVVTSSTGERDPTVLPSKNKEDLPEGDHSEVTSSEESMET